MYRISLVFLAFLFAAQVNAQGLNRERGRYAGGGGAAHCGTGNLSDCGTLQALWIADEGTICSAVACSDGGSIDTWDAPAEFSSGPTITCDPQAVGEEPEWDEVNANFNNNSSVNFVRANGDWCEVNTGANLSTTTLIIAGRWTEIVNAHSLWAEEAGTNEAAEFTANNTSVLRTTWAGATHSTTGTLNESTTYVLTWVVDGTSMDVRINGSNENFTVTSSAANFLALNGSTTGFNPPGSEIGTVAIYTNALSGDNLTGAECILSDKYALGLSGC